MRKDSIKKIFTKIEHILTDQENIKSVEKQRERLPEVMFRCELLSGDNNKRSVFVTFRCVEGTKIDISYMCIINKYKNFPLSVGKELAMELSRKYRFVKAYFREEDNDGEIENQFIGEYDGIYAYEKESFERSLAYISETVFSILGDFIDFNQDLLRNIYEEKQKKTNNLSEVKTVNINPNPFD